jgi:hypothetical protein
MHVVARLARGHDRVYARGGNAVSARQAPEVGAMDHVQHGQGQEKRKGESHVCLIDEIETASILTKVC